MKKFLPIIIILITSSCVVKEKDDTIIEFEELLTEHFESYKTDHREKLAKLGGGWVKKRYYFEGEYVYEAKKTSSTISPYEGICEFELIT